jgi:Ecdysteroid kinase-like family
MTNIPMPRAHDDLTAEWLTQTVRGAGIDATVETFTRRAMGEGVGMMATLELVDLAYSDGDGPGTVVIKLPAVNDANRAVALAFDIYRREVLFYRNIADQTSAGTPRVLLAQVDSPEDFVLVLEDLSDYRLGDQIIGCNLADAEAAMITLGQLHAPFWDDVDRPELDFVPYETPSTHGDALREGSLVGWDAMVDVFGDVVPEHMRAVKDRFLAAVPAMQRWLVTAPTTIVHGDFRMDNLFYGQSADHHEMVVIDWQGCLRSKGARDVGYLLSQSMPTELRREHERDLVATWHRTLVEGGVTDYSDEQAWEDYRRSVLALWTLVVVIAGTLDASNDRGRAWMTEMIRRSATTIDDLGLLDLLPEFESEESPPEP